MNIISENGLDLYLYKQNKTRDLYDKHLISCIFRGLDKDMDGRVSILDFVKSLSKTFTEEKRNIETVDKVLEKLSSTIKGRKVSFNYSLSKRSVRRPRSSKFRKAQRQSKVPLFNPNHLRSASVDQKFSTPKPKRVRKFSMKYALTWKQLINSGNDMALVYVDNSGKNPPPKITPFKTNFQRKHRSAKEASKHF